MSFPIVVYGILIVIGLLFFGGIGAAIYWSKKKKPDGMPDFLQSATTTINALLATNLGAQLGISVSEGNQAAFMSVSQLGQAAGEVADPGGSLIIAGSVYVYFVALLVAVGGWWWVAKWKKSAATVPTLPEMSKTFLGVGIAVLAAVLSGAV